MTCLEAQSKIIAYIDHKLDKEEQVEFLKHVSTCKDCKEELDIYYTMIEGMRQLDENMPLSRDFTQELNNRIERELKHNRTRKDFLRTSVGMLVIGLLGFALFTYVNFLNLVHEDEQHKLKQAQSEYYYSDTFHDILFTPKGEEQIRTIHAADTTEELDFYDRVRQNNLVK